MKKLKIGVALSGGGICGVAHIGFLNVLIENGIKIDMVAGISMGSIVGGLFASGMTPCEMENAVKKISKGDIFQLNVFKLLKEGVFSGKKIEETLSSFLKTKNIEDAKIKYFAQAADLKTGKLHTFESGPFVTAMRASSAIPGVFAPVYENDTCYVDGGVIDNVPYKLLKEKGADVIIAVDCLNDYKLEEIPKNTFSIIANSFMMVTDVITKKNKKNRKNMYDIYCYDTLEGLSGLSSNLKDIPRIIEAGKQAGEKYIFEIKNIIEKKKKLLKNTWFSFKSMLTLIVNYG